MQGIGATGGIDTAAMLAARQSLAKASAMVAQDRLNHSPSCVACDQKLVDKAQDQLARATTTATATGTMTSSTTPRGGAGGRLDVTA